LSGDTVEEKTFFNFILHCLQLDSEDRPDATTLLQHAFIDNEDSFQSVSEIIDEIIVDQSTYNFDFGTVLNRNLFSDLKIIVDNNTIHCHRLILENRFPQIINIINDSQEIVIQDSNYETVYSFLDWIYSGKLLLQGDKTAIESKIIGIIQFLKPYNLIDLSRSLATELLFQRKFKIPFYTTILINNQYIDNMKNLVKQSKKFKFYLF